MHGHKIWRKQCQATRTIRRRFGLKNALDYLVREKLLTFAEVAEQHPEFAAELPGFQAAVWEVSPLRACRVPGFAAAHDPEEAPETSLGKPHAQQWPGFDFTSRSLPAGRTPQHRTAGSGSRG